MAKENFFVKKEVTKCTRCLIDKKDLEISRQIFKPIVQGTGKDILIVLSMVHDKSYLNKFIKFLSINKVYNYTIVTALECQTKEGKIPSPAYEVYKHCQPFDYSSFNCKVIVTIGRALYSVTQSDDILYWSEFSEYHFNETFFYHNGKRVYPLPELSDWLELDCFEKFFVREVQIPEILNWLSDYKVEIFEDYKVEYVDDPNKFLEEHMNEKEVAEDTETTSLDPFDEDFNIICVTMSFDGRTGYYLPFEKINKRLLSRFHRGKHIITAEGKFDAKAFECCGVSNFVVGDDVISLSHILNTERQLNSIKSQAWLINLGGYDKELDAYKRKYKIKSYANIPKEILINYASMDVIVTYRLRNYLLKKGQNQPELIKIYQETIIPVIDVFKEMEMNGMYIDFDCVNKFNKELSEKTSILEKEIKERLGDILVSSSQQLGRAMEEKGFPCISRSKKEFYDQKQADGTIKRVGYYNTGDQVLKKWKKRTEDPLIDKIIEYKELEKLRTTFVGSVKTEDKGGFFKTVSFEENDDDEGIVKFVKKDGKVHSTFRPGGTSSIRSSCKRPNLQQIPKQGKLAESLRPIFLCPEDYEFLEADYSGFQLRIGAIFSKDPTMIDIFNRRGKYAEADADMHSITNHNIFFRKETLGTVLKNKKEGSYKKGRFNSKGVNFGFVFGRTSIGFKPDLEEHWTDEDIENYIKDNNLELKVDKGGNPDYYLTVAEDLRNKFFETYPGLEIWIRNVHDFAKQHGYTIDPVHGLKRHLPRLSYIGYDDDKYRISSLLNIAVNSPVQGFEALEAYKAMIEIRNKNRENRLKSKFVCMVHDSFTFYCYKGERQTLSNTIEKAMNKSEFLVPIECDIEVGKVWGFGKDIKKIT